MREVPLPAASESHGLTIGADGALWVALESGAVTRINIRDAVPSRWSIR